MPNKYIKKKISKYTQEDLINAVRDVKNEKLSMYAAAQKYGIPSTTLYDKIKETYSTNVVGRRLAIPLEAETRLANAIKIMEKWGFGLSREEVLNLVAEFVKKNNLVTPFKDGKPGKDWFINFRKRHRLSIKKPQPVEYVRKKMTDPFIISDYFKLLEDTLTDLKISESPHLVWNLDETSLSLDPTRTKVVGAINKPCSRTTCGTGKENVTVLTTVNAAGEKVSPLIVFKGKNVWDEWMATTENYNFELSYAASSKGWMETKIFFNYFEKILIPALGDERPVLIVFDGHSTHVDVEVIELAIKNDITILKLPPHTSHLLQPLDVAVFKSFKSKWDSKLVSWQRHNVGTKMPKKVFAQTFAETWNETNPDVIKSGFKKAGLYPFNSQVVPEDKYDLAAYRRYKDQKSSECCRIQTSLNTPKSLKELCTDFLNKELHIMDQKTTAKSETFLASLSKTDEQTQSFVAESTSTLPGCLQCNHSLTKENKKPKINIISDITINFEELLLERIRQDKKDNNSVKKKRVAKGAEVITASIYKKNEEEKTRHVASQNAKTRNSNGKRKLKTDIEKPGPSGVKKAKTKKQSKPKKIAKRQASNSCSTSISDKMSIYSELEFDNSVFEKLSDEFWDDTYFDIQKRPESLEVEGESFRKQEIICDVLNDRKILSEDLSSPHGKKGKGKGKKTKTGKENIYLEEYNIQESDITDKLLRNNEDTQNDETENYKTESRNKTEEEPTKDNKLPDTMDDTKVFREENLSNLHEEKVKGEGKKAKTGKEYNYLNECQIQDNETDKLLRHNEETENRDNTEEKTTKDKKLFDKMDVYEIEGVTDKKKEDYMINDAVLVRYFSKKKWTYYIGFIENIFQKNNETYFSIDFLKTIKRPHLTFILPKRKDRDEITELLIIKKVNLERNYENDKEFSLLDESDKIYF